MKMKKILYFSLPVLLIACGADVSEQSWLPKAGDDGSLPSAYAGYSLRDPMPNGSELQEDGLYLFKEENGNLSIEVTSFEGQIIKIRQAVPLRGKPKKELVFDEVIRRFGEPAMRRGNQLAFDANNVVLNVGVFGSDYSVILSDLALEMKFRRRK